MPAYSLVLPHSGAVPLLDEEFDKTENAPAARDATCAEHLVLCHDRAWDDQLDEGEEVSL